jgi:predicted transposase
MKDLIEVELQFSPENAARLEALQRVFTSVCNELASRAVDAQCWNRVRLHHLTYHQIREKYPSLGSQMTCNAIYSVSRIAKEILQKKNSDGKSDEEIKKIKKLIFNQNAPIYFDRHTVSLKENEISMFTMEGRIKFKINAGKELEKKLKNEKLKEIILTRKDKFMLNFIFGNGLNSLKINDFLS